MENEEYFKVNELDRKGMHVEAFETLLNLSSINHPLALFELSSRYYSTVSYKPPVLALQSDNDKSVTYAEKGLQELLKIAHTGDGEAMRMLGIMYLGHLCPHYLDRQEAEKWLLQSFEAGCYIAANDLHTLYLSDIDKAKFWYKEAEKHNCRYVYNANCET